MLVLLLYPMRKRIRWLKFIGAIRYWFQIHMMFGLFGPLLVLYHSNFSLGSINSQVAMFSMLTVASSGIIGRHLYSHIHHSLYGRKASLREFQSELKESKGVDTDLDAHLPQLTAKLDSLSTTLLEDEFGSDVGFGQSLSWALSRPFLRARIKRDAVKEIIANAHRLPQSAKATKKHIKSTKQFVNNQFHSMRRVAQFRFYERMFALWHILHLPLFFMMILSATAHVVAVHMY